MNYKEILETYVEEILYDTDILYIQKYHNK